jgi:ubiquitin carboxyl-terminal hydrolase 36/42
LGSCGLSDKVYNFMRARKRSCIQEAGNKPSGTDLKYVLINLTSVQFHRCSEL